MGRSIAPALVLTALILALPQTVLAESRSQVREITQLFVDGGAVVDNLHVYEVGGIVVIRGRATDKAQAERVGTFAKAQGFSRIANLIQITEPVNDAAIERAAERKLAIHRGFDGCQFRIASRDGVVNLGGRVDGELQRDMAVQLVRNIDGVREVRTDFDR